MYTSYLPFIIELSYRVGNLQLQYFRSQNLSIETKTNLSDVVTVADKESEALLVHEILNRYPTHSVLGEEGGRQGEPNSEWAWIVDPLDGTTNFSQGLPFFTISIALQHRGKTVVGVVYAPFLEELYYASLGGGAFRSQKGGEAMPIAVAQKHHLNRAVLATGFPYDKATHPDTNCERLGRILPFVRDVRRVGTAAYDLCCIAAGFLDGYWETCLKIWDVCAGNLLVEEAGGKALTYTNERGLYILAGNEQIIQAMQKHLLLDFT